MLPETAGRCPYSLLASNGADGRSGVRVSPPPPTGQVIDQALCFPQGLLPRRRYMLGTQQPVRAAGRDGRPGGPAPRREQVVVGDRRRLVGQVVLHGLDAPAGVAKVVDPQPQPAGHGSGGRGDSLMSRTHQYAHNHSRVPTSSSTGGCQGVCLAGALVESARGRRAAGQGRARCNDRDLKCWGGYAKEGARGAHKSCADQVGSVVVRSRWNRRWRR
jgi:hypothetical protein